MSTHPPPLSRLKCETEGCVFCRHTITNPSLARIARRRGSLCQHPSLETRDGGGVSFVNTPSTPPSLETREGFVSSSVNTPPPTPPSLKLRDRGVFSVNTPSPPLSLEMREGGFLLLTHHHQPLPHLNCQPPHSLPCSKRKTEDISLPTTPLLPPLLETQGRGGMFLCQPSHSLPCSKRKTEGGHFFANHPSPLLETQDRGGMFLGMGFLSTGTCDNPY